MSKLSSEKTFTTAVPNSTAKLLRVGLEHYQAAQLARAEASYGGVLAANPCNLDALHLLGVIAQQRKRFDIAAELIRQAIKQSEHPVYYSNLGVTLNDQGKLEEAVTAFRQAISIRPDFERTSFSQSSIRSAEQLRRAELRR